MNKRQKTRNMLSAFNRFPFHSWFRLSFSILILNPSRKGKDFEPVLLGECRVRIAIIYKPKQVFNN